MVKVDQVHRQSLGPFKYLQRPVTIANPPDIFPLGPYRPPVSKQLPDLKELCQAVSPLWGAYHFLGGVTRPANGLNEKSRFLAPTEDIYIPE